MRHYKTPAGALLELDEVEQADIIAAHGYVALSAEQLALLFASTPLTKEQQVAEVLKTIGRGRDRSLIQTIIRFADEVSIPKLAADNNVTYEFAKAAAYARNPTYKAAVDCEAACRAIETAP